MLKWVREGVRRGWLLPVFRVVSSVLLLLLGAFLGKDFGAGNNPSALAAILLLGYLLIFVFIELMFAKTSKELEAEYEQNARAKVTAEIDGIKARRDRDAFNLAVQTGAADYLINRFQATSRVLNDIVLADSPAISLVTTERIKKIPIISETLREMCRTLKVSEAARSRLTVGEIWFRATYVAVTAKEEGGEELRYIAYDTPGGHEPKSMSEGIAFGEGDGCAGLAWKRSRPVIEDEFRHGKEWKDNYHGQGELYESMVCVPVQAMAGSGSERVIGVITVDTNICGFFGAKDSKADEERAGRLVRPYADFIAFVCALNLVTARVREWMSAGAEKTTRGPLQPDETTGAP